MERRIPFDLSEHEGQLMAGRGALEKWGGL